MTVLIFLGSLLAVMALGVPIAYALLLSWGPDVAPGFVRRPGPGAERDQRR